MRKIFTAVGMAGAISLATLTMSYAAPVPGFEALYQAAFAACTPANGVPPSPEACEAAINAYSAALIAAGIDPAVVLTSFTALRAEVAAAGGGDAIAALFEALLPETGAINPAASPT
jgi:hypothetical protein